MMQNAASLDNLRDLAEPPPVSWWPLAPGWWVIAAAATIALGVYLYHAWQRWQANAYRRAALSELRASSTDAQVAEILKRTALCAYSRETVAAMSGERWCRWLGETADVTVSAPVTEALTVGVFQDGARRTHELTQFATHWIRSHRMQTDDRKDRDDQ